MSQQTLSLPSDAEAGCIGVLFGFHPLRNAIKKSAFQKHPGLFSVEIRHLKPTSEAPLLYGLNPPPEPDPTQEPAAPSCWVVGSGLRSKSPRPLTGEARSVFVCLSVAHLAFRIAAMPLIHSRTSLAPRSCLGVRYFSVWSVTHTTTLVSGSLPPLSSLLPSIVSCWASEPFRKLIRSPYR